MLNKRIRSLIDEIFSDMRMTAENLALRDELMANAQSRFEDALARGESEEAAFAEVAGSLGDVQALLAAMNGEAEPPAKGAGDAATGDAPQETPAGEADGAAAAAGDELSDALNKALTALGDIGRQIVPQAKKLARQADEAAGGAFSELGKAVNKGMQDAQRAAQESLDRLCGKKDAASAPQEEDPGALREQAKDLRAQAELKQVAGDQEGARDMRAQAYALETRADALEQAQAIERAAREAAGEGGGSPDGDVPGDGEPADGMPADGTPADGTPADEPAGEDPARDAFSKAVDDILRDAQDAVRATGEALGSLGGEAVRRAKQAAAPKQPSAGPKPSVGPKQGGARIAGESRFPAAGLRTVDVKVDADDVRVEPCEGQEVLVRWADMREDSCPAVSLDGHTLRVRRANPDVFKTFFSVFAADGGQIVVSVPRGYAAEYSLFTTSGDVHLSGVDADGVRVSTTSGDVRLEPDPAVRAKTLSVGTVSGDVTVSACAGDIAVKTVSGDAFVSCDACLADIDAVSGDVHAEGASDEWSVTTVSGDAELLCTVTPSRRIQLSTVSGGVRVALPGDVRGFVAELSGMGGHIENEFGPNRYGTCALPIHMDTVSGDLTITRL